MPSNFASLRTEWQKLKPSGIDQSMDEALGLVAGYDFSRLTTADEVNAWINLLGNVEQAGSKLESAGPFQASGKARDWLKKARAAVSLEHEKLSAIVRNDLAYNAAQKKWVPKTLLQRAVDHCTSRIRELGEGDPLARQYWFIRNEAEICLRSRRPDAAQSFVEYLKSTNSWGPNAASRTARRDVLEALTKLLAR